MRMVVVSPFSSRQSSKSGMYWFTASSSRRWPCSQRMSVEMAVDIALLHEAMSKIVFVVISRVTGHVCRLP